MAERKAIDREKTCPFLVRLIWRINEELDLSWFKHRGDQAEADEVRLYAWKDVTLRELIDLIKEQLPSARRRDAEFNLAFVYLDPEGVYEIKKIGTVHSSRRYDIDSLNLKKLKYVIGDFIGLNLTFNLS